MPGSTAVFPGLPHQPPLPVLQGKTKEEKHPGVTALCQCQDPGHPFQVGDVGLSTSGAAPPWPPRADEHPQSSTQTELTSKMCDGVGVSHSWFGARVPGFQQHPLPRLCLPLLPGLHCRALSSGVSSAPAGSSSLFWAPEPGGTGRTGLLPAGTLLSPGLQPWPC